AVDGVAGVVHGELAFGHLRAQQLVAGEVDLDQVGGAHLGVVQAVGVDEEVVGRAGDLGRDVVVDQVGHAVLDHEAVAGGEGDGGGPSGSAEGWAPRLACDGAHGD